MVRWMYALMLNPHWIQHPIRIIRGFVFGF